MSAPATAEGNFFHKLEFDGVQLTVTFGHDRDIYGSILFRFVRAFAFFKESDFYPEFAKAEREAVFPAFDENVGVYRLKNTTLKSTIGNRFDEESPSYFLLETPDECFEIVAFADPQLALFDK